MKPSIFICWSGEASERIAASLRNLLALVFTYVEPFMSLRDIDRGATWNDEISGRLENSNVGIICLTPDNLDSPWIFFEAGALSKKIRERRVCTFLWHVGFDDVPEPLRQFQHTTTKREDVRQLLESINRSFGKNAINPNQLHRLFQLTWPRFAADLKSIDTANGSLVRRSGESKMLKEIHAIVRVIAEKQGVAIDDFDRRIASNDEEDRDVSVDSRIKTRETASPRKRSARVGRGK